MLINELSTSSSDTFSMQSIIPFFQSIIDLQDFGVVRYECLARLIEQSATTYKPKILCSLLNVKHTIHN